MNDTVSQEADSMALSVSAQPSKTKLIPLAQRFIAGNSERTVPARKLHEFLEVERKFASWITGRIDQYEFRENQDFIKVFPGTGKNQNGGRPQVDYYLTLDMAKELAMVERTAKGREARRYFIACERELRERHAREQPKALPAPEPGLSKALRQAVNRKAYALSLQGFDTIRAHLTGWADMGGTNFAKGSVSVRALMDLDFGVRHPENFTEIHEAP